MLGVYALWKDCSIQSGKLMLILAWFRYLDAFVNTEHVKHALLASGCKCAINLSKTFLNFARVFRFYPMAHLMKPRPRKGSFVKSQ